MDQELKEIKKYNDFNEYDQAIRRANARKPKKPLKIHGNNFNLITSEKDQVNISKFFQKLFSSSDNDANTTRENGSSIYT